jgi:SAM-dependent methyltransferase
MVPYNQEPIRIIKGRNREIAVFATDVGNIDFNVIKSFGDEWLRFQHFSDEMIARCAREYFDIVTEKEAGPTAYVLDIGCGTGRWTKHFSGRAGFIEAIDPSEAIFAADNLLGTIPNVRLTKAVIESIPFEDATFDLVMSVGVLHHLPDPAKGMRSCVKKLKPGGHFYCYLYHNLETKSWRQRMLFRCSEMVRKIVCRLPMAPRVFVCDLLAVAVYLPLVSLVRLMIRLGFEKRALKMPLGAYHNKSFFIIRNDSLDKFGTKLEHRFSRLQLVDMMKGCGLADIKISEGSPYYHAIGKKL